jgi:hypothetical protein
MNPADFADARFAVLRLGAARFAVFLFLTMSSVLFGIAARENHARWLKTAGQRIQDMHVPLAGDHSTPASHFDLDYFTGIRS